MVDVSSIIKQLKKERDRVERQLAGLDAALIAFGARLWLTIIELIPSGLYIAAGTNRKSLPN